MRNEYSVAYHFNNPKLSGLGLVTNEQVESIFHHISYKDGS